MNKGHEPEMSPPVDLGGSFGWAHQEMTNKLLDP